MTQNLLVCQQGTIIGQFGSQNAKYYFSHQPQDNNTKNKTIIVVIIIIIRL